MFLRTLRDSLAYSAKHFPVIFLTGPRQSGKTTLARASFSEYSYVTLESADRLEQALDDPRGFLDHISGSGGAIIDEAQNAPQLFSYIQEYVDVKKAGPFVLTGSQHFLLSEKISQSLAGRAAVLELLPLSVAELEKRPPRTPDKLLAMIKPKPALERDELLLNGLFPKVHSSDLRSDLWYSSYIQTYLERDVRAIANIGDISQFYNFLRLCAGRSGQLLSISSLASDADVSPTTAKRWLSVLQASYTVYLLPPHHRNFSKRLVKSKKLYITDCGLMCSLLGIQTAEQLFTHPLRGAVFETFVVSELRKVFTHSGQRAPLYFWRDNHGHEVDVVVELGEALVPIEVKSSATVKGEAFDSLERYLRYSKGQVGVLAYGGDRSYRHRSHRVWAWDGCS